MNSASKFVATELFTTLMTGAAPLTVMVSETDEAGSSRSMPSAEPRRTRTPSRLTVRNPSSFASIT